MAAPSFMLRTVASNGTLEKFLPDYESIDMSPVFSGIGTVVFKYPQNGANFSLLAEDAEIAVTMNGVEIGGLRSIIEAVEGDDADEAMDGAIWSFTCRTLLSLFDRAVVYPKNWPTRTPPTHDFSEATPGKILGDLLTKAQGRGALTGVTLGFSPTKDSNNQNWVASYDVSYDAGITYTEVIQSMVESEILEVQMEGRVLKAYNFGGLGVDRAKGTSPLRFHRGRDIKESPRKISTRELGTVVLAAGDNNLYAEQSSDSATMAKWGRREWYFSANSIPSNAFLQYVATKVLDSKNRPLLEVTHGLHFENDVNPRPITNFQVGDWALTSVGKGWERYRIKQWVMSVSNSGEITGSVTLNDLIAEQLEKLNKKIDKISGGLSGTGSSNEKDDGKPPSRPSGVSLGTDYYMDGPRPRAVLTVQWNPVTTNSDGTPILDLNLYRVRWKYSTDSTWRQTVDVESDQTNMVFAPLNTNSIVQVQVGAVDKWNRGSGYSDIISTTTAQDTLAPAKPSPPVVTSTVGMLRVTWSGLDFQGQQQVADFAGVEVHVGPSGTFTPSPATLKDFLTARSNTATTLTGLTYGTEYWVRLVAVDTTGNKSPASDETLTSHALLKPVVNVEIGSGQVGLGNINFSDIGNLVEDGTFENADLRAVRQILMDQSHMSFDNTTASNGIWSMKISGQSPWNTEELILQRGLPAKPGERIFGAADYRASADSSATCNCSLIIRFYDRNGALLDDVTGGAGTTTTSYGVLATNTNKVALDGTWKSRITNLSKVAPPNTVSFNICLRTMTHTSGTVWVDSIEVRRQVDTLMVADAAVGNAQIADLAVNNAKIADLSVGKLTTGTLDADIVLASRIKTANTGARAEMNSGGFGLWNSAGVQTFFAAASSGDVKIRGQFVSDYSGRRIEINPSSTYLPEIRFYPSSGANYAYLNAVDNSGGSSVSVGLNSGSFTSNGLLSQYRVFLTDGSEGGRFETVSLSGGALNGGYCHIGPQSAGIGVYAGNRKHGFVESYHADQGWGARIGYDGTTDSTDCWMNFYSDGSLDMVGRWDFRYSPVTNAAIVVGNWNLDVPVTSATWTWGTTGLTQWYPHVQVRDQGAHAVGISSLNRTTFDVVYDTTTIGTSGLHIWAWRTY